MSDKEALRAALSQAERELVEKDVEINRLMRVYTAAADFVDDPFGSLDQRKFYALRESFYPTRDE